MGGDDASMNLPFTHLSPVLMAAQIGEAAVAPEWVHLVPAGQIATVDGRGPYSVADAEAVIAASFAETDQLPIDENHSTDLAAPNGLSAPARGWIKALQARADGIWGQVDWTGQGRRMVAGRSYRMISPVVLHDAKGVITRILRASLVNKPNLRGLVALNQETPVNLMEKLAAMLGLEATATEEQIMTAITAMKEKKAEGGDAPAMQAALTEIGTALGVQGDATAILAAAKAVKADNCGIVALQAELTTVSTQLNSLKAEGAKAAATAFVDGQIAKGRVGVKPLRDHYIARHMAGSADVEKEITALPILTGSGMEHLPPAAKDGEISLNAAQTATAKLLGIDPKAYAATLKSEQAEAL